jgi:hypothetical protein
MECVVPGCVVLSIYELVPVVNAKFPKGGEVFEEFV